MSDRKKVAEKIRVGLTLLNIMSPLQLYVDLFVRG